MAARRFSLVLRGAHGPEPKAKLLDHYNNVGKESRAGLGANKPESQKLYFSPFSANLPAGLFLVTSASVPAWAALGAQAPVAARVQATIPNTAESLKVKSIKAARVIRKANDRTGTQTRSKLTGLPYKKYNRPSLSVPFGRDNATDTYSAAKTAIFNAVKAANNSVIFVDEES